MANNDIRLAMAKEIDALKAQLEGKIEDVGELSDLLTEHKENLVLAVNELIETKLDKTEYAGVNKAGVIKLLGSNGNNRSGIVVSDDGTVYVSVISSYGLNRTGDGKVVIAKASDAEIDIGTNQYKPIVPSNLMYAVEQSITKIYGDLKQTMYKTEAMAECMQVTDWNGVESFEVTTSEIEQAPEFDAAFVFESAEATTKWGTKIPIEIRDENWEMTDCSNTPSYCQSWVSEGKIIIELAWDEREGDEYRSIGLGRTYKVI